MIAEAALDLPLLLAGLQRLEHELLLFTSFWFIVAAVDELAVDLVWVWLRLTGRTEDAHLPKGYELRPLSGPAAVLVPAWHEAEVIGQMIAHALTAWPQHELRLFVGCYRNDPATVAAAMAGAAADPRVRLVIHDNDGPTTKADCLNRVYAALCAEEERRGVRFASVVLHDAEDWVHPAALPVIDHALGHVQFVQLPVRPEPQRASPLVAGHYSDEFAEAHGKSLVVRDALGAAIPAAGVGCGFSRDALARLAEARPSGGEAGPFSSECLTEDYELGLLISGRDRQGRFLRVRDADGDLVATRAFFPGRLDQSVRQKARWIHGIALQGWDRLGWSGRWVDVWMTVRDRRGPLTAIVLFAAYLLVVIEGVLMTARWLGWRDAVAVSPVLSVMLGISAAALAWRLTWRFGFTAREYGIGEGLVAVGRTIVANFIAILAGRRAVAAYLRTLRGAAPTWEKTPHSHHPAGPFAAQPVKP